MIPNGLRDALIEKTQRHEEGKELFDAVADGQQIDRLHGLLKGPKIQLAVANLVLWIVGLAWNCPRKLPGLRFQAKPNHRLIIGRKITSWKTKATLWIPLATSHFATENRIVKTIKHSQKDRHVGTHHLFHILEVLFCLSGGFVF